MVVMILERVKPSLRGDLTRWLIQPKTGVFVGRLSARVRDLLWQRVIASTTTGSGIMLYSDNTEQGFSARAFGDPSKVMLDFEGLFLARTPKTA